MTYRADIDGLRAVAITSVLAFHGFPAVFPGGFVGVDIFFVISGYLISKIIIEAAEGGGFSYLEFYDRRARRILPALLVVSAAVMVAAFFIVFPIEMKGVAASLVAAMFFGANIFFFETSGYFAQAAAKPVLLHYWSLGVEEQFYLLFPVAVSFACRFGRRALPVLAAGLFLASLILSEYQVRFAPEAAFYLLPSRAWELMTGTLVFFAIRDPAAHRLSSFATIVGAALIVGSVALLAPSSRFPGLHALPACLGTALVIYFGAINPIRLHAMLGSALPRGLGKISFSLYLVHWPVLLFSARLWPFANPSLRGSIAILASIAIATLLFIAVETPFRRGRPQIRHASVCRFAAASIAGFAVMGSIIFVADGFPQRLNQLAARYSRYTSHIDLEQFRSYECFMNERQTFDELKPSCIPVEASETRKVAIIWGDSGIAQYAQALARSFQETGYTMGQLTLSACPPLIGYDVPPRPQCRDFNDRSLAAIIQRRPALVVLGWAYWDDSAVSRHLAETLDRLNAAKLNVVVLGCGPRFNEAVPNILARRAMQNDRDIIAHSELDLAAIRSIDRRLLSITSQHPPVRFLPVFDTICPNEQCKLISDGLPAHFDSFHVTAEGAKLHVDRFFDQLLAPMVDRPAGHI